MNYKNKIIILCLFTISCTYIPNNNISKGKPIDFSNRLYVAEDNGGCIKFIDKKTAKYYVLVGLGKSKIEEYMATYKVHKNTVKISYNFSEKKDVLKLEYYDMEDYLKAINTYGAFRRSKNFIHENFKITEE